MDSARVKITVYILTITAIVMLFGLAVTKLAGPANGNAQSKEQQLQNLEKSPDITSPQAKGFIQTEKFRMNAAHEAEKAAEE